MKLTWLGHSGFRLEAEKKVYIDPFLTGNPMATVKVKDVKEADVVIVTHSHDDHLGDSFAICKKTGAVLVSQHEIAVKASDEGIESEGSNIGGFINVKGVNIAFTQAWHTSSLGSPTGVVIEYKGHVIYHTGDTGLFSDMKLIGELFRPKVALVPIGGRFTMDIDQAVKAVGLIGARVVIPMHYNTWPVIGANPSEFKEKVGKRASVAILDPGESYNMIAV